MHDPPGDERVRRTRGAIVGALNAMILDRRPYAAIRVSDITAAAGVGRSTFYEHYRGKDGALKQAVEPLLSVLADAVTDAADDGASCTCSRTSGTTSARRVRRSAGRGRGRWPTGCGN